MSGEKQRGGEKLKKRRKTMNRVDGAQIHIVQRAYGLQLVKYGIAG